MLRYRILIFSLLLTLILSFLILVIVLIYVFHISFFYIYGLFALTLAWICSFIVLMSSKRLPASKISWIFVIFGIPFLGIIFFLLFGRKYYYKKQNKFINHLEDFYALDDWTAEKEFLKMNKNKHYWLDLYNFSKNISLKPILKFTDFRFFIDGVDKMASLYEALLKAKKYIHIEYFIISDGFILNMFLKILKEKSEQGVDVKIIYDGLGSMVDLGMGYLKHLKKSKIQIKVFASPRTHLGTTTNYRNHRKSVIIDGEIVYFGGVNIGNEYIGITNKFGYWRDNHIFIKGPAVTTFELNFLQDWEFVTKKYIKNKEKYLQYQEPNINQALSISVNEWVHTIENNPSYFESLHYHIILKLFTIAKKRIWIQTPYLILSDQLIDLLKISALSNVDVRIITPAEADKKTVHFVTRLNYQELIPYKIKIYEYQNAFFHAKGILIDDDITFLGSTNLDYRSVFLNYELASVFYSSKVAKTFEEQYLIDLSYSKRVYLDEKDKYVFKNNILYISIMKVLGRIFTSLL